MDCSKRECPRHPTVICQVTMTKLHELRIFYACPEHEQELDEYLKDRYDASLERIQQNVRPHLN